MVPNATLGRVAEKCPQQQWKGPYEPETWETAAYGTIAALLSALFTSEVSVVTFLHAAPGSSALGAASLLAADTACV